MRLLILLSVFPLNCSSPPILCPSLSFCILLVGFHCNDELIVTANYCVGHLHIGSTGQCHSDSRDAINVPATVIPLNMNG